MNRHFQYQRLSRRDALTGVLLALTIPGALRAEPSRLAFAAIRNGRQIGEQRMSFASDGDSLLVHTIAEMAVKLGPVTLYHYRHEANERWKSGRFDSLDTQTNANGKLLKVTARRTDDGVEINSAAGLKVMAPAAALPFSHWNRKIATAPLFNPQDGKLVHETVVATPRKLSFRGDVEIDDFYDDTGTWVGLIGKLSDGSRMEYRPI
ncbi:MAG TPA: DUF6134 family protein [Caulobacteraceae bacterium]|nr:DUF6134 family protein [Caulobacteraceae bacterium]